MNAKIYKGEFFGKELVAEFSDLAEQTNGSVVVRCGDTAVLVTVVMKNSESSADYFPLSVEYEEKFYAAGKIIGSRFIRREGRPSDEAVLTGRLIDRAIRPLFNQNFRRDVQVVTTVLSLGDTDADWPALIGASLAIATSDILWNGPIAGIRVAKCESGFIFAPSFEERAKADFDAFYTGDENGINMIEFSGSSVPENIIIESLEAAQKEFGKIIDFQRKIIEEMKPVKILFSEKQIDENLKNAAAEFLKDKLEEAIYTPNKSKKVSNLTVLRDEFMAHLLTAGFFENDFKTASFLFEEAIDEMVSRNILEKEKRPDGRGLKEVRALSCELDILPRVHGSAIFKRGSTHALSSVTLGAPGAEQMIETIETSGTKRFIHHYNFPPYCTGEVGSMRRGPGRRELGHGGLAEKALFPIIPNKDEFPYTIRVVSEILSSNGSSSMASVCGSSLALMAAGVPIKAPVAGIAMGLITDRQPTTDPEGVRQCGGPYGAGNQQPKYKILTDIQGPEDHHGDMDLKVAGTRSGVNAIQMDVKVRGVNLEILKNALERAKEAREFILDKIESIIPAPRAKLSPYAPKITTLKIDPEKIGMLIGPGGKTIKQIIAESGVDSIDVDDDGSVFITALTDEALQKGVNAVSGLAKTFEVGEIIEGTVSKILDFGAVIDLNEFSDGLLHISELANFRVNKVEDIVRFGDKVKVKIIGIDSTSGKISLSIKALLLPEETKQEGGGFGFHESRFDTFRGGASQSPRSSRSGHAGGPARGRGGSRGPQRRK